MYIYIFPHGHYLRFPIHSSHGRLDASQQVKVLRSTYSYALSEAQSASDEITIPQSEQVVPFLAVLLSPSSSEGVKCLRPHVPFSD